jgi:ABC-type uncharacterized transport system permease subunit
VSDQPEEKIGVWGLLKDGAMFFGAAVFAGLILWKAYLMLTGWGFIGVLAFALLAPLFLLGDVAWKATEEWRFRRAGRRMKK